MKPAPFKYFAPETVDEALTLLHEYGYEAKVLAGGQSLVPTMNFRLAQPTILVDLNRIGELFYITENQANSELHIGAMTRQCELERNPLIEKYAPLIFETMPYIAHPQIRNRGTIGGSVAHADPAAELPAVMSVLNARFRIRNQESERWVTASDFFVGLFATVLEPEELLMEIAVPRLPPRSGWAFREMARRHGDYALVGVACVLTLNENKECEQAQIGFLSVGEGPVMAHEAALVLVGKVPTAEEIGVASEVAAAKDIDPPTDIHASADFRRHLAKVLTQQALTTAYERAKAF